VTVNVDRHWISPRPSTLTAYMTVNVARSGGIAPPSTLTVTVLAPLTLSQCRSS